MTYRCGRGGQSLALEPTRSPSASRRMHSLMQAYHLVLQNVAAVAVVAVGTGAGMAVGMYVAGTGLQQQPEDAAAAAVVVGVSKICSGVLENHHPPSH